MSSRRAALCLVVSGTVGCVTPAMPGGNMATAPGTGGAAMSSSMSSGGAGGAATGGAGASAGGTGGADLTGAGGSSSGTGGVGAPSGSGGSGGASTGSGGTSMGNGGTGTGGVTTDTGADTPATPGNACPAGQLLCEDFERYGSAAALAPTWGTDVTGGKLEVDATRAFSGGKALHLSAPTNTSSLLQIKTEGAPLFPMPGNSFHGRMMLWISKVPTGTVHFNTVQANGPLPGTGRIAKYAYGAMYGKLMAGYTVRVKETDLPTIDCGKGGPTAYPEQRWVCAEWKFDGANHEMHYWLDGQAQTGVDVLKVGGGCTGTQPEGGLWQAPTFNKLMLGWYAQPFAQAVEVWIDDVVVAKDRVGCPSLSAGP